MAERNLVELQHRPRSARQRLESRRRHPRRDTDVLAGVVAGVVAHQHHGGQARQGGGDGGDRRPAVELLAPVAVPAGGEQHLRGDLREPVDHAVRPEVRRAGGPDRAQAGGGEQADQGGRDVGQEGGDPVAAPHAQGGQPGPDPGYLGGEFAVGQRDRAAVLPGADNGNPVRVGQRRPQGVARVVERGPAEPGHIRHRAAGQHRPVTALAEHLEVVPHRPPERARGVHRPAPQCLVIAGGTGRRPGGRSVPGPAPGQPAPVAGDPGPLDHLRRRRPQHLPVVPPRQPSGQPDLVIHRHAPSIEPRPPARNVAHLSSPAGGEWVAA